MLALFIGRVAGQALVAFFDVQFLPPMDAWGLTPYAILLPAQLVIIALMAKICVDFTRERDYFYEPKRWLGKEFLWFGCVYLAAMLARALLYWDRPIPIVFHWVLAAFVIVVGESHRRRLKA